MSELLISTVVRQWMVLSLLPPPPEKIGTSALREGLQKRGLVVHLRTLQRDLVALSRVFPLFVDSRSKPYGWRWRDDVEFLKIPSPPPSTGNQLEVRLRGERRVLRVLFARLRVQAAPHVAEDAVILRLDDTNATRRMLLAYADDVEILEPAALRSEIVKRARRIVALQKK